MISDAMDRLIRASQVRNLWDAHVDPPGYVVSRYGKLFVLIDPVKPLYRHKGTIVSLTIVDSQPELMYVSGDK